MEETSLSVDEMNALRARIGLAPLRTGGGGDNGSAVAAAAVRHNLQRRRPYSAALCALAIFHLWFTNH